MTFQISCHMTTNDTADEETRDLVQRGAYGDVWYGEWFSRDVQDIINERFATRAEADAALMRLRAGYLGADSEGVEVLVRVI